jgi:uncharacterized membrane protein (UPF0127 family)
MKLAIRRIAKVSLRGPVLGAIVFVVSVALASEMPRITKERIVFRPGGVTVLAERADSPDNKARGLMYRTFLGQSEGMIFYFEESGYQTFWMHNTRLPLTIIFLNERLRIVDIQDMQPCLERNADLCKMYTSRSVALYAIEVNQGFARKHGINVGDRVTIEKAE